MKTLAFLAVWMPSAAFACLWVDGTTMDGHIRTISGITPAHMLRQAMAEHADDPSFLYRFGDGETSPQGEEAEAVNQILHGNLDEAIQRLSGIEKASPGGYSTAANLGTAYELKGDNVNALKWITAGMARNPESHHGTEWLHALILEAKVEAAKHPGQPLPHHLLELPERMQASTSLSVRGKTHRIDEVWLALHYQLQERLVFVKPKDPYVADLLYCFGLIEANLKSVESGRQLLQLAREYGFPDESLLVRQEERFASIQRMARIIRGGKMALGIVVGIGLLCYGYRRKWFFLSRRGFLAHRAALAAAKAGN